MTIIQKQALLVFLGYDTGGVDGILGEKTRNAIECAQKDLGIPADGIWGPQTEAAVREAVYTYDVDAPIEVDAEIATTTGTFWDEIEFFDREEFRCQCKGKYCNGFHVEPNETMVRTVNEIRRRLGVPVSIVDAGGSGVRCPKHNANVGGVTNSLHVQGKAADLHSSKSPQEMYRVAEEVLGNTGELGLYSWGIHVDTRSTKARWNG